MSENDNQKDWDDMVARSKDIIDGSTDWIEVLPVRRNCELMVWADERIKVLEKIENSANNYIENN